MSILGMSVGRLDSLSQLATACSSPATTPLASGAAMDDKLREEIEQAFEHSQDLKDPAEQVQEGVAQARNRS
jgi:hypothetical protein